MKLLAPSYWLLAKTEHTIRGTPEQTEGTEPTAKNQDRGHVVQSKRSATRHRYSAQFFASSGSSGLPATVIRGFTTVGPLSEKSRRVVSQMIAVIYPFFALAAVGFAAMLVVHVASLFGNTYLFERTIAVLVPGMFVVFLPTIFVMNRLTRDFKQKDLWRAALRGCPRWMYLAVWGIFVYGWAGFFVLPLLYGGGMNSAANKARGVSGALLVFYLIPLAVMYSATHAERFDESRRCLNGHRISPFAKFCEECGAAAATSTPEFRR